jgi:small subunit ribosomal protein S16
MKRMGRLHRPFYRICAMDQRAPRDGKVIELLGTYDPMVSDTDARVTMNCERVDYWLGVGAQPSEAVRVLVKKYGTNGTRRAQQQAALERMAQKRPVPPREAPKLAPKPAETSASEGGAESETQQQPAAATSEG